jgi:uncharacterized protein
MIIKNREIDEIEDIMIKNHMFEKYNLSRVGIFGSTARGEKSNDIDILIDEEIDYKLLAAFKFELQNLLNKSIDLVIAKFANPILLHRAKKEIVYVVKH